ncbi:MAG: hypothetical protein LM580_05570 [Thermofilum sp.]|nr:hypothetical protein [Thermofilum sp.]
MGEEELEKTAAWAPKYPSSPMRPSSLIVVARRWRRKESESKLERFTFYEIILLDERKERGTARVLWADDALSLAAFILLTADKWDMSDDCRRKLREAARVVLSEAERIIDVAAIPEDVREGW